MFRKLLFLSFVILMSFDTVPAGGSLWFGHQNVAFGIGKRGAINKTLSKKVWNIQIVLRLLFRNRLEIGFHETISR